MSEHQIHWGTCIAVIKLFVSGDPQDFFYQMLTFWSSCSVDVVVGEDVEDEKGVVET